MLENAIPLYIGLSRLNCSCFDSHVVVGFVDLGMQMGVAGDGMGVCKILGLVVCLVFEDNATDFE